MSKPTSTSRPADADPLVSDWVGLHVFYHGDADPLLTGWLRPTVERLRASGAAAGYFFIRYWLEGDHVRVRVRPGPGVRRDTVAGLLEEGIARYLGRHPSAGRAPELPAAVQRAFFLAEYDQSTWDARYGSEGTIPVRANNTWRRVPYEPEYRRYGGPLGVELAEWHFEVSSDVVLGLLGSPRSRRLGVSARLALVLCATFLDDDAAIAGFLAGYRDFWHRGYGLGDDPDAAYGGAYRRMAGRLRPDAAAILAAARGGGPDPGPVLGGWVRHCRLLRERVTELARSGGYESHERDAVVRDASVALRELLPSFVHMTNNRLGITIAEEAYLAHLTRSAVSSPRPDARTSDEETP